MISKSPQRNSFQKEGYLKRQAEKGKTPENDKDTQAMVEYYESWNEKDLKKENDPEWQHNNMEYDLRTTQWILDKVRTEEYYAQNLYAAMCNMRWCNIKGEHPDVTMGILKDELWSCSWRYAGGIIADMRQSGDYIDWYCSGIRNESYSADEDDFKRHELNYVAEGEVTEEIASDLKKLGWIPVPWKDDD